MNKYIITVDVDEETLRECREDLKDADIETLLESEMGWLERSGGCMLKC